MDGAQWNELQSAERQAPVLHTYTANLKVSPRHRTRRPTQSTHAFVHTRNDHPFQNTHTRTLSHSSLTRHTPTNTSQPHSLIAIQRTELHTHIHRYTSDCVCVPPLSLCLTRHIRLDGQGVDGRHHITHTSHTTRREAERSRQRGSAMAHADTTQQQQQQRHRQAI